MSKKIKIPKALHELFGKEQTLLDLAAVILFTAIATVGISQLESAYLSTLTGFQKSVALLLLVDIAGGVIANLSKGTDAYYGENAFRRRVFIAIHIQPLVVAFALGTSWLLAIGVWATAITGACILSRASEAKALAGVFTGLSLLGLFYFGTGDPEFVRLLYGLYLFKVPFSFSVRHHV